MLQNTYVFQYFCHAEHLPNMPGQLEPHRQPLVQSQIPSSKPIGCGSGTAYHFPHSDKTAVPYNTQPHRRAF